MAAIEDTVTTFNHQDHLQSGALETDSTGAITSATTYLPYGADEATTGSQSHSYGFTDQERDTETGLYYYDARYYDSEIGRFTSVDPISIYNLKRQIPITPQALNTYSYTVGNPIKYNDPSGEIVPVLLAAWAIAEISLSAYDVYTAGETLLNQDASITEKAAAVGGLAAGVILPGGGYGAAGKSGLEAAQTAVSKVSADALQSTTTKLPDNAIVCRGGQCGVNNFLDGSGVTVDPKTGLLDNISVQSAPGQSTENLIGDWLKNNEIGVTTVGDVRVFGGDVVSSPTLNNPFHSTMSNVDAEQASKLTQPTIKNPNKKQ